MAAEVSGVDAIICDAIDIPCAEERAAYIAAACGGDMDLQNLVQKLVAAHFQAGRFMETPALDSAATIEPTLRDGPGTMVGPFKLLEQIGEGGFGLVFMAEQQHPVRRQVAVKILKPGMDSRQVIARFEAERQALALMDHPNIARVLDAGETASGRPHFVMELARGVPITEYCDQNGLSTRQRLELFVTVCEAVQYAHQKGIIHRDIKPSNVLVTLQDGVVKIIDFGIAKAIGQSLTDKTLHTGVNQMIGTPLYMSPEQAQMGPLDVDTRSDVYSLGALLHELLTGTTPFSAERLRMANYDEVRRIIRDEDPLRPSARIATLGPTAVAVATRRQSAPQRLSRLFRGELDWIVMKALEKDRTRRYESASAFAADVNRFLRDEPVAACPPSTWYRFTKFARRNKPMLTTVALVSLALVIGTAVSVWQTFRATDAMNSERATSVGLEKALIRLKDEETATQRELFDALVAQARANRLSRRIGQRFGTLELLRKATALARQLKLPPERFLEVRNEAIAALALADMRVALEWTDASGSWMDFDANLERYARADSKGDIFIRRAKDAGEICRLPGNGPGEIGVQFSPNGRYLAVYHAGQRRSEIWQLDGDKPVRLLFDPKAKTGDAWQNHGPAGACFSADSSQVAVQRSDGSIELFDLTQKKSLRRLPPVPTAYQLTFDPTGRQLGLACRGSAQVCDLESGKIVWNQSVPAGWPFLKWHPNGRLLGVADDNFICLWDVRAGKMMGRMDSSPGTNFSFDRAGGLLASTGWDGKTHLWDPRSNRQLFSTWASATALCVSPDGRFLATPQRHDQTLRIWEVAAGHEYRTLVASPLQGKRPYRSVAITPDGHMLAAGAAGAGGIGLWNLSSGKELGLLPASAGINYVLLEPRSPDARRDEKNGGTLLIMGVNGLFRQTIRTEPGGNAVDIGPDQRLPIPGADDAQIAQSLDGRVLAAAQFNGALALHADHPDQLIKLGPHDDVRYIAVSPDGRWIATGRFSSPGGAKLWKADAKGLTYKCVMDLPGIVHCRVVFSPDGKSLLLGGSDVATSKYLVRRWQVVEEVETWVERPFKEPIEGTSPAYSHDGRLLAVEMRSGIARLLNAETGTEYARLEDPDQHRTNQFAFTPDGMKLACATGDGHCVHVWDLQTIRRQLAEMNLDWK